MGKLKKINMKMTSNTTPPPFKVKMISNTYDYGEELYKCLDGNYDTGLQAQPYSYDGYHGIFDLYITLDKSYLIKNIKIIDGVYLYSKVTGIGYTSYSMFISLDNGSNFFSYSNYETDSTGIIYKFNNQISSSNLIIRFVHTNYAYTPRMKEIELYAEMPNVLLKNLNNRFISINNENYQNDNYKILDSNDLNNLSDDLFYLNDLCKETEINNKKIIPLQEILKENKNGIKILKIV